jgi:predicted Zn-dependent protease
MARAGYDPKGSFRVMNVLGRSSGAEIKNDTHPLTSERIQALNNLMKQYPYQTLAAEGAAKLRSRKPLTFDISKDGMSLLINSRFGS